MTSKNPKYLRDKLEYKPFDSREDISYTCHVYENSYSITKYTHDKASFSSYVPALNSGWKTWFIQFNRKKKTAKISSEDRRDFYGGTMSHHREYEYENIIPYDYALRCWKVVDKLMKKERTDEANTEFGQRFEMLTHYELGQGKRIKDTLMEEYEAKQKAEEEEQKLIDNCKPMNENG